MAADGDLHIGSRRFRQLPDLPLGLFPEPRVSGVASLEVAGGESKELFCAKQSMLFHDAQDGFWAAVSDMVDVIEALAYAFGQSDNLEHYADEVAYNLTRMRVLSDNFRRAECPGSL
ncbi:MAG: hypothetical protein K2X99_02445 [Gemmatimonadaceae bacterium]|nr:hypothetical protein [Gemmatimonadaceae bacterium]